MSQPVHRLSVKAWQRFARTESFAHDPVTDRWRTVAWLAEDAGFRRQDGSGELDVYPAGTRVRIVYPLMLDGHERKAWERLDRSRRLTYCRTGVLTPARVPARVGGMVRWLSAGDVTFDQPAPKPPPPAASLLEGLL